jgi:hypothetical protein
MNVGYVDADGMTRTSAGKIVPVQQAKKRALNKSSPVRSVRSKSTAMVSVASTDKAAASPADIAIASPSNNVALKKSSPLRSVRSKSAAMGSVASTDGKATANPVDIAIASPSKNGTLNKSSPLRSSPRLAKQSASRTDEDRSGVSSLTDDAPEFFFGALSQAEFLVFKRIVKEEGEARAIGKERSATRKEVEFAGVLREVMDLMSLQKTLRNVKPCRQFFANTSEINWFILNTTSELTLGKSHVQGIWQTLAAALGTRFDVTVNSVQVRERHRNLCEMLEERERGVVNTSRRLKLDPDGDKRSSNGSSASKARTRTP